MLRIICTFAFVLSFLGTPTWPQALAEQQRPASPNVRDLSNRLRQIFRRANLGRATAGVSVIDVETGEVIFDQNAEAQLNPASNAKIVTAAAALALLRPEFRFITSVYGRTAGVAVDGPLYLRGRGDPTLGMDDILQLAMILRRRGIRVVRGDLVVDASYFDGDVEPPAYDQQPNERAYFRAPVSAVSFNRNVVSVFIRPAGAVGRPAIVTAIPKGYLDLTNDTMTVGTGAQSLRFTSRATERSTWARVWGTIPLGHSGLHVRSRIDKPTLFTGNAFREALLSLGIRIRGKVRAGIMVSTMPMLAQHRSPYLSAILALLGKHSDNFAAETLLKTMGAEAAIPGTWETGQAAASGYLESIGIEPGSYQLLNGSGLFDANRYSTTQLVRVLRAVWRDQTIRAEFVSQLAVGGVDGTLGTRFRSAPALRNVRAKTGTLAAVTALTGYVLAPPGRHTFAFSILVNNARGRRSHGIQLQNLMVTAIAEYLHAGQERSSATN